MLKEKYDGEIRLLNEQINSAKMNDLHIKERIKAINDKLTELQKEKESYVNEKNNINSILKEADETRKKEFDALAGISENIESILAEIEEAKNEIIDLLNQKSAVKSKYRDMIQCLNRFL